MIYLQGFTIHPVNQQGPRIHHVFHRNAFEKTVSCFNHQFFCISLNSQILKEIAQMEAESKAQAAVLEEEAAEAAEEALEAEEARVAAEEYAAQPWHVKFIDKTGGFFAVVDEKMRWVISMIPAIDLIVLLIETARDVIVEYVPIARHWVKKKLGRAPLDPSDIQDVTADDEAEGEGEDGGEGGGCAAPLPARGVRRTARAAWSTDEEAGGQRGATAALLEEHSRLVQAGDFVDPKAPEDPQLVEMRRGSDRQVTLAPPVDERPDARLDRFAGAL